MVLALLRRSLLGGAACAAPALFFPAARAQTILPERGLRILVGFQANGGTDIIARLIATQLQRRLGRHVVVENKPGDFGRDARRIGEEGIDRWLDPGLPRLDNPGLAAGPSRLSLQSARRSRADFARGQLADGLAVSPKLGISTFEEYLNYLKSDEADRRKLGTTASDAFIRAFNLMFSKELGITMKGVPFRGAAALVGDLADGRIPAAVSEMVSLLQHHRGGRVKLLMTTSSQRLAVAKAIPTARELGYSGLEVVEWFAYFAKAGTAAPVIDEWNRLVRAVLDDGNLRGELTQLGLDVESSTPQELTARVTAIRRSGRARMQSVGMQPIN